jgi:hypothetical protein
MTDQYLEQWERLNRWYERFKEIHCGREHTMPSENYKDEVYAFFLNCYHLKDWLIEDNAVPAQEVEDFINDCDELKLCADICNAIKHLVLHKKPRSGVQPEFTKKDVSLTLGPEPADVSIQYTIETAHGPIDAFDIAKKNMEAWETFFSQNGLRIA